MKGVIYARYSCDNQREESIEGQLRDCKEYAKRHDILVVDTYIDRAFSAKTDRRPAFQQMIKDSAKREFEAIIVWKLDRFARNRYDSATYKAKLRKNGVRVISANENISEGSEGILLESVLEGMAEYYSADLSEKVLRGHMENALKCKSNGGGIPIGFYVDEEKHYQIDPLTAPLVREAFESYADGKKVIDIAENLGQIDTALGKIGADIMYRYAELDGDKPLYRYYKTSHTDSFLSVSTGKGNVRLESDEFFSTAKQPGAMALHLSSLFQDTAIYPLMQAQQHDLTAATWYVAEGQLDAVLHALKGLGYSVTATNERLLSTKLPLYFLFIPAFMLCVSIVFYTLSAGKKNVLKKMEGYTTGNILLGEIKAFAPALCLCFLLIFAAAMICAVWLHPVATWQFGLFLLGDCLWLLVPLILGILLSLLFLSGQRSAEYVKGKVPKRGIYITNTLAKAAFLIFILFSLTIAMRNITQIYNTFHAAEFCSQKTKGYVTVPLNNVNSGRAPEGADYLAFYYATVDRYNGILMAANDFNYDLFEGKMLGEAYGQDYAHINRNYLAFNPIYAPDGEQIGDALLSDTHVNILLPKSKEYRRDEVRERGASWGNSGDVNIVLYDDKASDIYSYNASTGLGGNGALPAPILVVKEGDLLDGLFIEAWCSQGAYFLYVPTDDPYAELLPILRETGIDAATVSTPTVAATFDKMLHHLTYMLMIWGVQALVLLIGLFCLILFGARLYCDNYRDRIACRLIEGHSLLSCIRTHLVLTVLYYGAVAAGLLLLKLAIELDYNILLGTLLAELLITLLACGSIARKNLYQIVKGAEA